jgi:hypothetical protein
MEEVLLTTMTHLKLGLFVRLLPPTFFAYKMFIKSTKEGIWCP